MTLRRTVLCASLLCLLLLVGAVPASADPDAPDLLSPTNLAIQGLSVYSVYGQSPQRITINFRIVNLSLNKVGKVFRTRISPGTNDIYGSPQTFFLTTGILPGKQTLYVSRTVLLPPGTGDVAIAVEADVDHVLYDPDRKNNVATTTFTPGPTAGRWVSMGPTKVVSRPFYGSYNATGRLAAIAIDPRDSNTIYVGSPGQLGHEGSGAWKTTNAGRTWQPLTDSFPTLSVAAIAVDPGSFLGLLRRVYVVAPDYGLYRSDDEGTSWLRIYGDLHVRRNTDIADPTRLLIDPNDSSRLYLTTTKGVMRSKNGGASWTKVIGFHEATALVMDPVNTQVLYAAVRSEGVWKTVNGGDNWSLTSVSYASSEPRYGILLGISHPPSQQNETVYALMGAGDEQIGFKLYRSVGGETWEYRSTCISDDCDHSWVLDVDPSDPDRIYVGGFALFVSNGGYAWMRVPWSGNDQQPASPHGDYHGWAIDPADPNIVYAATDGGIFRSDLKGEEGSWAFIGEGITNAEIYDVAASGSSSLLLAGTQDNGTITLSDPVGGPTWTHIYPDPPYGGDGGLVAIDPTDDQKLYTMFQDGESLVLSRNGGWSFNGLTGLGSGCANWNMTFFFQLFPANPADLYASCGLLWYRNIDSSTSWTPLFGDPSAAARKVVRSAINPAKVVYAGLADGRIYAGIVGLKKVYQHPTKLMVTDMELEPSHPDRLYATFSPPTTIDRNCSFDATTPRIIQIVRKSSLSITVANITGNLPLNLCVNTIALVPSTTTIVLAGTQKGVYRGRKITSPTGRVSWLWSPYNQGMPPADVRDLEYQPSSRRLFAATFGRGVFMMPFPLVQGQ